MPEHCITNWILFSKDSLIDKFGFMKHENCSIWPQVPVLKCLNNDYWPFTELELWGAISFSLKFFCKEVHVFTQVCVLWWFGIVHWIRLLSLQGCLPVGRASWFKATQFTSWMESSLSQKTIPSVPKWYTHWRRISTMCSCVYSALQETWCEQRDRRCFMEVRSSPLNLPLSLTIRLKLRSEWKGCDSSLTFSERWVRVLCLVNLKCADLDWLLRKVDTEALV